MNIVQIFLVTAREEQKLKIFFLPNLLDLTIRSSNIDYINACTSIIVVHLFRPIAANLLLFLNGVKRRFDPKLGMIN